MCPVADTFAFTSFLTRSLLSRAYFLRARVSTPVYYRCYINRYSLIVIFTYIYIV